eukprot:403364163
MLHDQTLKTYSPSPQRYMDVGSSDFKFSIDPEFEVDEADEEFYKRNQQSNQDVQVNSGKHLVPRLLSSQQLSKSSSQITQFSVDLKRQSHAVNNNLGYSMQSSINSDAMRNLILEAKRYDANHLGGGGKHIQSSSQFSKHQSKNQSLDFQNENQLQQQNYNIISQKKGTTNNVNKLLQQNTATNNYSEHQSFVNTQNYLNIQQPTTNYQLSSTNTLNNGLNSTRKHKSLVKHKKNYSIIDNSKNQKSSQNLIRTSHQDIESMLQYVNGQKNNQQHHNSKNIRAQSQGGSKSLNSTIQQKSRQQNQTQLENQPGTYSFGKVPQVSNTQSQFKQQNLSSASKKQSLNSHRAGTASKLTDNSTMLNSTSAALNISNFIKNTTIDNVENSINIGSSSNGNNNQMYFQNLNDLLQNKIKDQMQELISRKKEMQQKVKEQEMIRQRELDLEDSIQAIIQKQHEKCLDYEQESQQLNAMLDQQQQRFDQVKLEHQQIQNNERMIIESQSDQLYQLEMRHLDCDETMLDLNMQHKQMAQNEEHLTKLVKDNNNQMSRVITIDNVDNAMNTSNYQNNKGNKSGRGQTGSVLQLNQTLNLSHILQQSSTFTGLSTNKSSTKTSTVNHSRSHSKNQNIVNNRNNSSFIKK